MTPTQTQGLITLIIVVALYLLPTIVALFRHSSTANAATIINIFLGWTLIGWVIALALAASGKSRTDVTKDEARHRADLAAMLRQQS